MAEKSIVVECRKRGVHLCACRSVVIKSFAIGVRVCRSHFSLSRVRVGVVVTHRRRKIEADTPR